MKSDLYGQKNLAHMGHGTFYNARSKEKETDDQKMREVADNIANDFLRSIGEDFGIPMPNLPMS